MPQARPRRAIVASVARSCGIARPPGRGGHRSPQAVPAAAAVETQASESAHRCQGQLRQPARNLILAEAAHAWAASIVDWLAWLGLTWRHWYRTGARALGQASRAPHPHLLATVCLGSGRRCRRRHVSGLGPDRTALGRLRTSLSRRAGPCVWTSRCGATSGAWRGLRSGQPDQVGYGMAGRSLAAP